MFLSTVLVLLVLLARTQAARRVNGAYLHIPFCRRRCYYCNFPIKVVGDRASTQLAETEAYVDLLLREIAAAAPEWGEQQQQQSPAQLETVYFGGGTPSLLTPGQVTKILRALDVNFGILPQAEVTLEMDPGTFDLPTLESFLRGGVTRVSMGVQSFDAEVLTRCGRAHSAQDVDMAIAHCHAAGLENFSVDLISSLPGVSLESWRDTLHRAVDTGCSHVSVYDLQVEDKTAFGRWYQPGRFPLPSDDESAAMYSTAVQVLGEAGFEHYEVSNYARSGYRSRHNQKYWRCESVAGFGMGAASYVDEVRATRPESLPSYRGWLFGVESGIKEGTTPYSAAVAALPGSERGEALDGIMLALRTADGLDMDQLASMHGRPVADKVLAGVAKFAGQGLVELRRGRPPDCGVRWLRLTDPKGFLVSNDIISTIFAQF